MKKVRRAAATVAALLFLITFVHGIIPAQERGGRRPLRVRLSGAAVVPQGGDEDGGGMAVFRLRPEQGEVCYELKVNGTEAATAASVRQAAPGQTGPLVVALSAPANGVAEGCVSLIPETVRSMQREPSGY